MRNENTFPCCCYCQTFGTMSSRFDPFTFHVLLSLLWNYNNKVHPANIFFLELTILHVGCYYYYSVVSIRKVYQVCKQLMCAWMNINCELRLWSQGNIEYKKFKVSFTRIPKILSWFSKRYKTRFFLCFSYYGMAKWENIFII